jgi:transcription initiation factor IIE alpha subunit
MTEPTITIALRNDLATVKNLQRGPYGVTSRDLMSRLGIKDRRVAARKLKALRDAGYISYAGKRKRGDGDQAVHRVTRLGMDALLGGIQVIP